MERVQLFAICLSILGALVVLSGFLYKKMILIYKGDKRNEYADILILEGLFVFLYGIVFYFYLPNLKLRLFFITLFFVLQTVILVYKKNATYWLTTRIAAIEKIISTKETKADTVYWMYTALIVTILVMLSLPYWINPSYPHNYIATIFTSGGLLLYIRSFLFKNNEGRASLYDLFSGLALICLALLYYFTDNVGFSTLDGKLFIGLIIVVFKREPPRNSET